MLSWDHDPHHQLVESLTGRLASMLTSPDLREKIQAIAEGDQSALGRWITLSHWCDETLGTQIVGQINDRADQVVRGLLGRRPCHLAHAGAEKKDCTEPGKPSRHRNGRPAG